MAVDVPIFLGNMITWSAFAQTCYDAILDTCCNIDTFKGVPSNLQSTQGTANVYTISDIGISRSKSKKSATWTATPHDLISLVTSTTVENEWHTFLTQAGVDVRSNKVIQAQEIGLLIGLYMQFMAFHLKPIYSRRQIFNASTVLFQGTQYKSGDIFPNYTLTPVELNNIPDVTNVDIQDIVRKNLGDGESDWTKYILFSAYNNPGFSYYTLG